MKTNTPTLTNASPAVLQDAWHYAMMLVKRSDSTFDGDRAFPTGIRGQVKAYEELLEKLDHMTADNETWELVRSQWWQPESFEQMLSNARMALDAINEAAARLGIEARTGEKPEIAANNGLEAKTIIKDMLETWEEHHGANACDCRSEPENRGHVCVWCRARVALNAQNQ